MILETKRLYLREMTLEDMPILRKILQDEDVMYAYAHAFDEEETKAWLNRQRSRYEQDGFGLWAVILKENNEMIGQCGLTKQALNKEEIMEIGYLFQKKYWHQGYAREAAYSCMKYAFKQYPISAIYSIIRDTNKASKQVAIHNGMQITETFVKHYYGIDMPHEVYCRTRKDYEKNND